uniref:DNA_mis_repair domain-containing protein n=1 Tax=Wuchereria bancrofti TaxID=6293 RepID=A0A1I8EKK6_WUCBA
MENADRQMVHARIHTIPIDVCRKICTGQVIITLAGACKELIDNSLDAQAKTIEVRVRKMGFERMEVVDDGKPHSTSKLTNFADFNQLTTFGFRGEALSSLCAVSSLSITTRHADEIMATKLEFDHDGFIKSREKCARPVGTTISINNLFETLPVRRKEFERSVKKAFTKLLNVVQSFALSRTDVRFVVNSLMDGKQYQALVTPGGNAPIKDIIVNLFGARFEKGTILDIIQQEPDESICSLYGISDHSKFDDIKITGYISSCVHGQGRSTADRQFIYFNKRPIDYSKLCRIANEVYQQYNRGQYCMLILFVDVPPESIDVNVAPDKRSVFFEREKELFALLRASLLATFAPHLGHVNTSNRSTNECMDDSFIQLTQSNDNDDSSNICTSDFQSSSELKNTNSLTNVTFAKDKSRGPSIDLSIEETVEKTRKRPAPKNCTEKSASIQKRPAANLFENFAFKVIPHNSKEDADNSYTTSEEASSSLVDQRENFDFRETSLRNVVAGASKDENTIIAPQEDPDFPNLSDDDDDGDGDDNNDNDDNDILITAVKDDQNCKSTTKEENSCGITRRSQQTISFSMSDLKNHMNKLHLKTSKVMSNICDDNERVLESRTEFHVDNPEIAENELAAYITKKDFECMEILGQFNKGFIIVRLNNDLFIIDQHASDEKYNFERFQKKARIQTQHLLSPRVLDLGVVKEAILRDNIDIFNYNGFEFQFDDEELVGKRALLTAIPVLQSWQFSISDIDEMLSVLCDFPGMMYRPAKLRKLFASRACRKSVMIGSSLTMLQMQKIVRHLGTLDHPWNCPHGRPTLRHLCVLKSKPSN